MASFIEDLIGELARGGNATPMDKADADAWFQLGRNVAQLASLSLRSEIVTYHDDRLWLFHRKYCIGRTVAQNSFVPASQISSSHLNLSCKG